MSGKSGLALLLCLCLVQDGAGQLTAKLARSTASFSIDLFRQLVSRDSSNIVFSPTSVYTAMGIALAGSNCSTKKELQSVMYLEPSYRVHKALHDAFASIPEANPNVTFRVANTVYYDDRQIRLTKRFVTKLRRQYGGLPHAFRRPEPEKYINQWVSDQTEGAIKDFLQPGIITGDTLLLLLNAILFQGTWKDIFDENATSDGDFTKASGQIVSVPMMSRDGEYSVKAAGNGIPARVLELPYSTEGRFSMFIILPDDVDLLSQVEQSLTAKTLEAAVTNMPEPTRYLIKVPKFTMRYKTSLKDILKGMGLVKIFDHADFSRMVVDAPSNLAVDDCLHEAVIKVNERGTLAAGVTAVEIVLVSLPPQFIVKHPFLFVLRDKLTKLNLFMGRVVHPHA